MLQLSKMPGPLAFFLRVISLLRKDCEVLHYEFSVVQRWEPIARKALIKVQEKLQDPGIDFVLSLPRDPKQAEEMEQVMKTVQRNPDVVDAVTEGACTQPGWTESASYP